MKNVATTVEGNVMPSRWWHSRQSKMTGGRMARQYPGTQGVVLLKPTIDLAWEN
ncbi:hypothetical protein ACFLVW_06495 [Chloroflexota bacterium]